MPASRQQQRVLVLGADALDYGLVRKGIAEGWLPTLAAIAARGRFAVLDPPQPGLPGAAWPTLVTGTPVTEHRLFLSRQLDPGTYATRPVTASGVRRPPFWSRASAAGLASTIASVYSSPVLVPFRGTQVIGWGTADPYTSIARDAVFRPPSVDGLLRREVGWRDSGYFLEDAVPRTAHGVARYVERKLRSIDQQARGLIALMTKTQWSLFFGSFYEPHAAGHALWGFGPDSGVRAVYAAVDGALGRLIERADDAHVLVVTPHGMGPNFRRGDALTPFLETGGWLVPAPASGSSPGRRRGTLRWARPLVPRRALAPATRMLLRIRERGGRAPAAPGHDLEQSRAFLLPDDGTNLIRVNLAGREPAGTIGRGAEYERMLEELRTMLLGLRLENGRPAVAHVVSADELGGAPARGAFPDLAVVWAAEPITSVRSDALGLTVGVRPADPRTGQHRPSGFVLATGPGIEPGEGAGTLLDVAPTVLGLLGLDEEARGLPGMPLPGFATPGAALRGSA